MRILVIEDEKKVADFLFRGLSEEGYRIDIAPTGAAGFAMATSDLYGLIILDLMLPDTDGIALCPCLPGPHQ